MGYSMVAFLKEVNGRAKDFLMSQQPTHPELPRRGAAVPPRSQLRITCGGAPPCCRLKGLGRHAMISESRTASSTQLAGFVDDIKDSLYLVFSFLLVK
jgi:hypothetical protein